MEIHRYGYIEKSKGFKVMKLHQLLDHLYYIMIDILLFFFETSGKYRKGKAYPKIKAQLWRGIDHSILKICRTYNRKHRLK